MRYNIYEVYQIFDSLINNEILYTNIINVSSYTFIMNAIQRFGFRCRFSFSTSSSKSMPFRHSRNYY